MCRCRDTWPGWGIVDPWDLESDGVPYAAWCRDTAANFDTSKSTLSLPTLLIQQLTDSSSQPVNRHMRKMFGIFELPNTIISDNGPCFIGKPFQIMVATLGINHITSSPHHPRSHGLVERAIRTVKAAMRKAADPDLAMLALRTTPMRPNAPSPAELLFGQRIPCDLPTYVSAKPKCQDDAPAAAPDSGGRELPPLSMDQPIFYQDVAKRTWAPGIVIGIGPEPRSYTIECCDTGRSLRRNRVLLRPRTTETNRHTPDDEPAWTSTLPLPATTMPVATRSPQVTTRRNLPVPTRPPPTNHPPTDVDPTPSVTIRSRRDRPIRQTQRMDL